MEIDSLFVHIGLDTYVPKAVRYLLVGGFFLSPLFVLIALLCCCFDDEPVRPEPAKQVRQPGPTSDPIQKKQVLEKID